MEFYFLWLKGYHSTSQQKDNPYHYMSVSKADILIFNLPLYMILLAWSQKAIKLLAEMNKDNGNDFASCLKSPDCSTQISFKEDFLKKLIFCRVRPKGLYLKDQPLEAKMRLSYLKTVLVCSGFIGCKFFYL